MEPISVVVNYSFFGDVLEQILGIAIIAKFRRIKGFRAILHGSFECALCRKSRSFVCPKFCIRISLILDMNGSLTFRLCCFRKF